MTKPQIWVAAFLLLFIVLFMLGRLTRQEEPVKNFSNQMNSPGNETNEELTGEKLFANFGCVNCHGAGLAGTVLAPPLTNLKEHWGRDNLISYLRNPSSFMDSDRFKEFRKKYPGQIMPSYSNKDIKELGKVADYLLTK
jgi:mono/diheme cytochrome c family protein